MIQIQSMRADVDADHIDHDYLIGLMVKQVVRAIFSIFTWTKLQLWIGITCMNTQPQFTSKAMSTHGRPYSWIGEVESIGGELGVALCCDVHWYSKVECMFICSVKIYTMFILYVVRITQSKKT